MTACSVKALGAMVLTSRLLVNSRRVFNKVDSIFRVYQLLPDCTRRRLAHTSGLLLARLLSS